MSAEDYFIRNGLPPGLTGEEAMPYGYRRWNGVIWADSWIDNYNKTVQTAVVAWRQGLDDKAERHVEAMYRMAREYDLLAKT